jgi:hypothetical protein
MATQNVNPKKVTATSQDHPAAQMSEEAKAAKNEYQREWRRKNPERLKHHLLTYWERKAQKQQQEANARLDWLRPNTCRVCGKELEDMREDAKFCSPACRQKHFRQSNGY